MKAVLTHLLVLYQKFVSPLLPSACRFYPTCSEYAKLCVQQHSLAKAFYLTGRRLLKCHPYHEGGFDPVP